MSGEEKVAVTVGGEAMSAVSSGSKPGVRVCAGASNLGGGSGGMAGEAARDRGGDLPLEAQDAERREASSRHPRRWLEAPGSQGTSLGLCKTGRHPHSAHGSGLFSCESCQL